MKVYYYHMVPIKSYYEDWRAGKIPGHLLYGLTHLSQYGVECIYHTFPFNPYLHKWKLMFYNLRKILSCSQSYDAVYAVTHTGLELLIFMRALGLFRKPIVIWHHTAVVVPESSIRRWGSALFYKGIDRMFFFSEVLLSESLKTKKLKKENAFVVHWGGDLAFYDRLIAKRQTSSHFISTGRENRDFITLIRAFSQLTESCDIYTTRFGGRVSDYELLVQKEIGVLKENIHFHIVDSTHLEMAEKTNNAFAILICCLDFPYTVGLTSLVEALALGLPILSTDNPTFPFDVEKEQVGIKIAYGEVNGWVEAIQYLSSHPEKAKRLGENARRLAERTYNLERCTKEIALALLTV